MDKKYELLLDNKIEYEGKTLYRIKALKDFRDITGFIINVGELGGYIESENNLSQEDGSWVCGNSNVYGDSIIRDSIIRDSIIRDSIIKDSIIKDSIIKDSFIDKSHIEELFIHDSNIEVSKIYDSIIKNLIITKVIIKNNVTIVDGNLTGKITMPFKDIFQYQCRNRLLTAILTEDNEILYTIGCKHNITEEEFIDLIYNENGGLDENPHRKEYLKLIPLIEAYFNGE